MRTITLVPCLALLVSLCACGGAQKSDAVIPSLPAFPDGGPPKSEVATTSAPSSEPDGHHRQKKPEVATGNTLTEFQKRRLLGHYSTNDGGSGFILDRTGSPFLAKLDGVDKVQTLSESSGPYHTKEYRSGDGTVWIRVDEEGRVLLFQGPKQINGVNVVRDADANRLR